MDINRTSSPTRALSPASHSEGKTPSAFSADVVGAGGIGICLAIALIESGWTIQLVESNPAKLEFGSREGIGVQGRKTIPVPLTDFSSWVPSDSRPIFLCTKGFSNKEVLGKIPANAPIFPVQNGFDPNLCQRVTALEGIASWISECPKNQTITRITRPGDLHFGPATGNAKWLKTGQDWVQSTRKAFEKMGIRAKWVPDTRPYKATKLIYNAAISPIASGAGIDNSSLLTDSKARKLFFALLGENIAIMRSQKIPLGRIGPISPPWVAWILGQNWIRAPLARYFAPTLKGTYCSMAEDFPTGLTELDHYNGHLVRLAGDYPCPVNQAVVSLVEQWLSQNAPPNPRFLDELETMIETHRK